MNKYVGVYEKYLDPEAVVVCWFKSHSSPCIQICVLSMKSKKLLETLDPEVNEGGSCEKGKGKQNAINVA